MTHAPLCTLLCEEKRKHAPEKWAWPSLLCHEDQPRSDFARFSLGAVTPHVRAAAPSKHSQGCSDMATRRVHG